MITIFWVPFGIVGIVSWTVWALRRFGSHWFYRDTVSEFRTTTSVVVPVYKEDADVLERCLRSWLAQNPTEVILVVDEDDELLLERLHGLALPRVRVLPWRHTGKRGALGAGVRAATPRAPAPASAAGPGVRGGRRRAVAAPLRGDHRSR